MNLRDLTNELLTKIAESEMVADMYRKAMYTHGLPKAKNISQQRLMEASTELVGPRGVAPTVQDWGKAGYKGFVNSFAPTSQKSALGNLAGNLIAQSMGDAGRSVDPIAYKALGSAVVGASDVVKKYSPTYKQLKLGIKSDLHTDTPRKLERKSPPMHQTGAPTGRNTWDTLLKRKSKLPPIRVK